MKVLHVTPAYAPNIGGIEVLLSYLLPALEAKHGVRSVVCVGSPNVWIEEFEHNGVSREIEQGVFVLRFGRLATRNSSVLDKILRLNSALREVFAEFQPDVVHIHGPSRLANGAYRIANSSNIPLVLHVHGDISVPESFGRLCKETETVVAPSDFLARMLATKFGRTKKTLVCPNGLPTSAFTLPSSPSQSGVLRLLAAGRLEHNKGFDTAIQSVSLLRQWGIHTSLTLYGEGTEREALAHLAQSLDVETLVGFCRPVAHENLLREMSRADVVVVPSRELEGFGLVAAEASAMGKSVVVCDTGGLPEVVIHNVTGIVVPPNHPAALAKALADLHNDEVFRVEMARRAREFAYQRFSLGAMCDRLYEMYSRVSC
jgi:glycosyltransferase involved in cell wall biosynthesis